MCFFLNHKWEVDYDNAINVFHRETWANGNSANWYAYSTAPSYCSKCGKKTKNYDFVWPTLPNFGRNEYYQLKRL